ncbi:unnamed protein product [Ambrosiozyma monospora]|uniref:Unnamed protein product n=1 Tax=Ambrosiozyma monospora TaxID=43982 RepID=A0ACB5T8Z6_AMBMO|nr:unnamed protein product [Ambrosiozyma monospora]
MDMNMGNMIRTCRGLVVFAENLGCYVCGLKIEHKMMPETVYKILPFLRNVENVAFPVEVNYSDYFNSEFSDPSMQVLDAASVKNLTINYSQRIRVSPLSFIKMKGLKKFRLNNISKLNQEIMSSLPDTVEELYFNCASIANECWKFPSQLKKLTLQQPCASEGWTPSFSQLIDLKELKLLHSRTLDTVAVHLSTFLNGAETNVVPVSSTGVRTLSLENADLKNVKSIRLKISSLSVEMKLKEIPDNLESFHVYTGLKILSNLKVVVKNDNDNVESCGLRTHISNIG